MSDAATERTRVRRIPEKASYDRAAVNEILDEALICHVCFIQDGAPFVIPTIHARVGRTLYFHGSAASRMLRLMNKGAHVTVAVTLLDGIVAARSVFHHSLHYRSAVIMGQARAVDEPAERNAAFEAIQSPPVHYSYADGQYWDDTAYVIPSSAVEATVTLYYQSTSKEYITFLRDENTTNTLGQELYDAWVAQGMSPPEVMAQETVSLNVTVSVPEPSKPAFGMQPAVPNPFQADGRNT